MTRSACRAPLPGAPRSRRASWRDLDELERFVAEFTTDGSLLPRSRESLAGHLHMIRIVSEAGGIIGCGALHRVDDTLAEIRTLAVAPPRQGAGIGSRIVDALLRDARREGIERVFCLTRRPGFFSRMGFETAPHEDFPEKIWSDCRLCPLQSRCDEQAMMRSVRSRGVVATARCGG